MEVERLSLMAENLLSDTTLNFLQDLDFGLNIDDLELNCDVLDLNQEDFGFNSNANTLEKTSDNNIESFADRLDRYIDEELNTPQWWPEKEPESPFPVEPSTLPNVPASINLNYELPLTLQESLPESMAEPMDIELSIPSPQNCQVQYLLLNAMENNMSQAEQYYYQQDVTYEVQTDPEKYYQDDVTSGLPANPEPNYQQDVILELRFEPDQYGQDDISCDESSEPEPYSQDDNSCDELSESDQYDQDDITCDESSEPDQYSQDDITCDERSEPEHDCQDDISCDERSEPDQYDQDDVSCNDRSQPEQHNQDDITCDESSEPDQYDQDDITCDELSEPEQNCQDDISCDESSQPEQNCQDDISSEKTSDSEQYYKHKVTCAVPTDPEQFYQHDVICKVPILTSSGIPIYWTLKQVAKPNQDPVYCTWYPEVSLPYLKKRRLDHKTHFYPQSKLSLPNSPHSSRSSSESTQFNITAPETSVHDQKPSSIQDFTETIPTVQNSTKNEVMPQQEGPSGLPESPKCEKPFKCSFCEVSFNVRGMRNRHEKTHQGKNLHYCPVCNIPYKHQYSVKVHLRRIHGVPPF